MKFFQEIEFEISRCRYTWKNVELFFVGELFVRIISFPFINSDLIQHFFSSFWNVSIDSLQSGIYSCYSLAASSLLLKRLIIRFSSSFTVNLRHFWLIEHLGLEQVHRLLCYNCLVAGKICKSSYCDKFYGYSETDKLLQMQDKCIARREHCRIEERCHCLFGRFTCWIFDTIICRSHLRRLFQSFGHFTSDAHASEVFYIVDATRHGMVWCGKEQIKFYSSIRWVRFYMTWFADEPWNFHWNHWSKSFTNFRDIEKIKNGISEKASHFLNTLLTAIVCIVVSIGYGWQLTLIVISYLPIVCLMNFFIAKVKFGEW